MAMTFLRSRHAKEQGADRAYGKVEHELTDSMPGDCYPEGKVVEPVDLGN